MAVMQRKDGRWCVYYRAADGKKKWEYFGRGPEAEARAAARNAALGYGPKRQPGDVTFADVARAYVRAKSIGSRRMSENSLALLKFRLAASILPAMGHLVATRLTDDDLDRYVERRRSAERIVGKDGHGRPVKRTGVKMATISREMTDIKAILNFGVRRRPPMIAFNPIRDYPLPGDVDLAIIRPPSIDEAARIMASASEHVRRACRLGLFTGLRPGAVELLSLTWADVSWQDRSIRIAAARKGGPDRRRARTRVVPIVQAFCDELRGWYEADGCRATLPVIHFRGRPVKRILKAWHAAVKRAGIDRRVRPYDLRHAFVTRALEAGADIKALAEIVGSDPKTLMKHYQHVTTELRRRTVELLPFWEPAAAGAED